MEIEDRRNFLREMENLGQADKHRPLIETQISQVLNFFTVPIQRKLFTFF